MKLKVNRKASIGFTGLLAAAALWFSAALPAQNAGQPARAVRLSYVDGKVQLNQIDQQISQQGGQPLADQAVINTPLFEGTQIVTGDDGKAEVQFEDGSVARLSPASSLTLRTLSTSETDLVLDRGLAYFELQSGSQIGPISVIFADSVVTASGFTILRVNMDNPPGALAVFSGNAHVERGAGGSGWSGSIDLHGGQSADFKGSDPSNPNLADAIQPDSWDAWNSDRDQALNAAASSQTQAPSDLAGGSSASNPAWSDLDANGNWYNVPGQGYVWSPYDAANQGFDPYGNGAWVDTPGYGSVWASGYGWGYLPYQCGLWNFYDGFGWGWAPGFGGCSPWWGIGFYGGPRFGILPIGYPPIRRPGRGRGPVPVAGRVIAVNRTSFRASTALPARTRNTPVTIAGQTVQPLRPTLSRTTYQSPVGRPVGPGVTATTRVAPAAGVQPGARSAYVPSSRPAYAAPPSGLNRAPQAQRYATPPTQHYTAPAPNYYAPRSADPPAPAPRSYSSPPRPSAPPPSSSAGSHFAGGGSIGGGHAVGRR